MCKCNTFILNDMEKCMEKKANYLYYGMLLTRVFKHYRVCLDNELQEFIDSKSDIDGPYISKLGYRWLKDSRRWVKKDIPEDEPEETEEKEEEKDKKPVKKAPGKVSGKPTVLTSVSKSGTSIPATDSESLEALIREGFKTTNKKFTLLKGALQQVATAIDEMSDEISQLHIRMGDPEDEEDNPEASSKSSPSQDPTYS